MELDRTGALADLIRRARRRHISNLLLKHAVNAASVAMAGLILLLLAGTQILDWPWVLALVVAAGAAGFARIARQVPSPYRVAQGIDRTMALDDSLSTAWFYEHAGAQRVPDQQMRDAQYASAEALAAGVDVTRAVPFAMPRSLYAMAGLGLVATSLFALRYAVSHSLDLHPPFASIVFDVFNPPVKRAALDQKKKEQKRHLPDLLKQMGLSLDQQETEPGEGKPEGTPVPATESAQADKREEAGGAPKPSGISVENKTPQQNQEGEEAGEESAQNTASLGPPNSEPNPNASSNRQPQQNQENNSLMDKFREAVANLMSRLKNNQQAGEGKQMASAQNRPGEKGQQQGPGQKSPQGKGNQKGEGDQNGQSDGDEDGARQPQNGPGKQGGESDVQQSSKEGNSGIGKQDGSKDLKEAEQLAAMGKISEIFGKRAQTLTGEVMVEVASSRQQLKTAYSNRAGEHAESGGEIHRDEIPLAYQRYVQQYFEEVRKPGVHAEAKKETPKKDSANK